MDVDVCQAVGTLENCDGQAAMHRCITACRSISDAFFLARQCYGVLDKGPWAVSRKGLCSFVSGLDNIGGRRAFGAIFHIEPDPVSFLEGFKPIRLDGGVMHKDILAAFLLDKTESLCIVEPFDNSFRHDNYSLVDCVLLHPAG